ncbi:Rossmann-like and DUF2520 domain-containing protein [Sediminicola luteus]|nr:DUF2520 domain-containing protein [Sediminicola luteus]
MLQVSLIGSGNLAHQLLVALRDLTGVDLVEVTARNTEAIDLLDNDIPLNSDFSKLRPADIYILAVSDAAISPVSEQLGDLPGMLAHTSGSVPMNALMHENRGVFYPLQTFTKGKVVDFSKIPICIEASSRTGMDTLNQLAQKLSEKVTELPSNQRRQLHLAAVMANNFTNHIFYWAERFCIENQLDFTLLHPLIEETVAKMKAVGPFDAQTGPARRGDLNTLQHQLEAMPTPELKQLYQYLSNSIQNTYGKEL